MKKLLLVVTEDKWVLTHRMPLIRAAIDHGFSVSVVTRITQYKEDIEKHGVEVIPVSVTRGGVNPFDEIRAIVELSSIYKRIKPDLVHHIGIKNILYGSIAARILKVPGIVNAFAGLGYIYSSEHWKARSIRPFLNMVLRLLHRGCKIRVIFQNPDDLNLMLNLGVVSSSQAVLIRSSGVDLERFSQTLEPRNNMTAVMAGRLLWDKGVGVFAEAGKLLNNRNVNVRLQLVGEPDSQNPSSVNQKQLEQWQADGYLVWSGHSEDMPGIWANSNIGVLPSFYGEGVPKTLLEAGASGRPLIATDSPGCREIVRHDFNGVLIPERDPVALADAIERLVNDPELRKRMGDNSRKIVEDEFSDKLVASQTMELYREILCDA
ncbi:glycosyltransferase involved in cell wall biosynthesis [Thiogranum longum]|uniref:Glycosyltransferase involved in cell wall biosynthesis n=1 Tax=Thiogranum longum TaxID=1537524 RepID=A0A4R1H9W8_9GAMM|nr:glycosyltransferase family 4 protein [Thiogranum longum]TCK18108.1 glycosyltransferase involved in cell wall biosynthesis [Thiogranum longum]